MTAESGKALGAIDWRAVGSRKPLQVLGSERGAGDFRVKVADPNDGGRAAEFVVVREYGRYVVDLVATAGMHTEVVEAAGSREGVRAAGVDAARPRAHPAVRTVPSRGRDDPALTGTLPGVGGGTNGGLCVASRPTSTHRT
ncbi:MAG: hypothetical protein H6838_13620 [Planctomycetes bacterium]|nr:hypothetical protein [Planctomycetota bacterium]